MNNKYLLLFFIVSNILSINIYAEQIGLDPLAENNFYQLIIQSIQSTDSTDYSLLRIFYKGFVYKLPLGNMLGGQINISEKGNIPNTFIIVVAPTIMPFYKHDKSEIVSGLSVSENDSRWYELSLQVITGNNNVMSYRWNITAIPPFSGGLVPRDAIVIEANTNQLEICDDSLDNFTPQLPVAGATIGSRILFLPLLRYKNQKDICNSQTISNKDYISIAQCHIG